MEITWRSSSFVFIVDDASKAKAKQKAARFVCQALWEFSLAKK
jgi:hypothetical protein